MNIRREPVTEGLDSFCAISVSTLSRMVSDDLYTSLEYVRDEYLGIRNDQFAPARQRYEQCLFRLYEAIYLVTPHVSIDVRGFVFDDAYHDQMVEAAREKYDTSEAEREYEIALGLIGERRYHAASGHFEKGALLGHSASQFNYGISVLNGEGLPADPLESAFWFFMSAKNNNPKAMVNLAVSYRRGTGVHPNGELMLYWYAKAALQLFPDGVFNLGLSLQNEEVLRGNSSVGTNLKMCADQLDNCDYQRYAQSVATQILNVLADHVYNV